MKKSIYWTLVAVAYMLLFSFVYFVIDPRCINIFQQPAFALTSDFFWSNISVIGGLSVYLSLFLEQFTMFRFFGSLVLVLESMLMAFLTVRYLKKYICNNVFSNIIVCFWAVATSFVLWVDVKYPFCINIQVIILLLALNFQQLLANRRIQQFVVPVLAILLYHFCGPMFLYLFALCNVVQFFAKVGTVSKSDIISTIVISLAYPFVVYNYLMPLTPSQAFYSFIPQKMMFTTFGISPYMFLLVLFVPISIVVAIIFSKSADRRKSLVATLSALAVISVATFVLTKTHDNKLERIGVKMEVAAFEQDWNSIIREIRNNPYLTEPKNYDRHINFYYNMALAEKGQLADKIFTYPQRLGLEGMFLDRPVATNECLQTAKFYYDMGFVTGALHFAFESMTTYSNSHYVNQLVIDCLLVLGDYNSANIFIDRYSDFMFSSKFIADRKAFIDGKGKSRLDKSYISQIRAKHPKHDFYTSVAQNNMLQICNANRNNLLAAQYLLCSSLLQPDFDLFTNLLLGKYGNVDPNNMPKAYQEALILYLATTNNVKPGLEAFKVQPYVYEQFNSFQQLVSSNKTNLASLVKEQFPNTFWRYYYVDNPQVTGIKLSK